MHPAGQRRLRGPGTEERHLAFRAGRPYYGSGRRVRATRNPSIVLPLVVAMVVLMVLPNSPSAPGRPGFASAAAPVLSAGLAGTRAAVPPELPALASTGEPPSVPVTALASTVSAPLGIADLGSSPSSSFSTLGLRGTVRITSLATNNASLGSGTARASVQMNAFLVFENGSQVYDYWVQDVFELDTSTGHGYFEDNVWNASSPVNSTLDGFALRGNGTVTESSDGAYYADVAAAALPGAYPVLVYPATVELLLNASLDTSHHPVVRVSFADPVGTAVFDTITFPFVRITTGFSGFEVNAGRLSLSSCPRCVGDAELVVGGPYGGFQTSLSGPTDVRLSLERWTDHNYASVTDAVDYGVATAEGLANGSVSRVTLAGGLPGAELTEGTISKQSLWSASDLGLVTVSVGTTSAGGVAQVNGQSVPYSGGRVDLVLVPGTYNLSFTVGLQTYGYADLLLTAGEIETLEVGAIPLVFVPVGLPPDVAWTVALGNDTLRGTGEITFGVANGTYNFTVPDLTRYLASPSSGAVLVNGSAFYQNISWAARPASWESELISLLELPLGPVPLYVILAALTVLGVAAGLLGRRRRRPPHRTAPPLTGWDD